MTKISLYLVSIIISLITYVSGFCQSKTIEVNDFNKVIVSPHIQVTFKEGDKEAVTIESARLPEDKINIKVVGKTLRIYLDGAKMVTKNEKIKENGWKRKQSIYKGTQVVATVTYKNLKELSVRGEEIIACESKITQQDFKLKMYGECKVTLNALEVNMFDTNMYGEGYLEIKEGMASKQKYTVYGEGEVNTLNMSNENTKITAYGEGNFRIKVSDQLKVTAFGEATVAYNGNPSISRGIVIGEATIQKMD
ncbi:head GIN domain-containing protein [Aquimarina algicola]|uniref:DUF2807 domain-containing protein n=1 Tax=Aquimarina algicola TaxID=2589995 RepID=A0A504JNR2_9FLAO|nr:head GIN domain-containing protein [Aquimarina algicola]TPN88010.1 DUF2807 domain-containing protein [Aquimarina algicola]